MAASAIEAIAKVNKTSLKSLIDVSILAREPAAHEHFPAPRISYRTRFEAAVLQQLQPGPARENTEDMRVVYDLDRAAALAQQISEIDGVCGIGGIRIKCPLDI